MKTTSWAKKENGNCQEKSAKQTRRASQTRGSAAKLAAAPSVSRLTPEQQEIAAAHWDSAVRLAFGILGQWQVRFPREDVLSIAGVSLCEAAVRFNPSFGVKFTTFLFSYLRGNLIRELKQELRARDGLGREEDAAEFNRNVNEPEDKVTAPDALLDQQRLYRKLAEAIQTLNTQDRAIIERFYYDGATVVDLAKDLGYSRAHLTRWKGLAMRHLACNLADERQAA